MIGNKRIVKIEGNKSSIKRFEETIVKFITKDNRGEDTYTINISNIDDDIDFKNIKIGGTD